MLTGYRPFIVSSPTELKMLEQLGVVFPNEISGDAQNLISRLLVLEAEDRLSLE